VRRLETIAWRPDTDDAGGQARKTIILLGAVQQLSVAQCILLKSKMMVSHLPDHHLAPASNFARAHLITVIR